MIQIKLSNAQITRLQEAEIMRDRQYNVPQRIKWQEFVSDILQIVLEAPSYDIVPGRKSGRVQDVG